ncbi:MAG: copper amine oxidase N-terminal domain-containing protein [Firmicutes bacterium]|nr:copper amine oxidase N-terminal domain-containing protein [Bacillota bacterium]
MVPMRVIFEALGATVQWDDATKTVTATKDATVIKLTIGSETAYKNDESVSLDAPGMIVDDRTLVPLRFVSEALGAQVAWDGATQTVSITSPASTPPAPETTTPDATNPEPAPETTTPDTTNPEPTPETTTPDTTNPEPAPETTTPDTTNPEPAPETTAPDTTTPETAANPT